MDFEAPDGSQISCREVWKYRDGDQAFDYTTISAYIDGVPYVTKSDQSPEDIDVADALNSLEPVPLDCVQPRMPDNFTVATNVNIEQRYLKAPSFTWDDCQPGNTFVADCMLNEVSVLEQLQQQHPHKNIATYHGCVVKDGRISHICLKKYSWSLPTYVVEVSKISDDEYRERVRFLLKGVEAAIVHLHSLGLAHNDINIDNACVDDCGNAILVDFDSCLPFGRRLMKGVADRNSTDAEAALSDKENDYRGLEDIEDFCGLHLGQTREHLE